MNLYTVHVRAARPPVLVREAFSWGALFFGPLWFAAHRSWLPAALALAALLGSLAVPPVLRPVLCPAALLFCGVFGRDAQRWSLARRGFTLDHVVAAPDADAALLRLLGYRTDMGERLA